MSGNRLIKKLKLGYFNHGHFLTDENGQQYIAFDIAIWAERFGDLCDKYVCFLNNGGIVNSNTVPKSYYPLTEKASIVDIGKQAPHRIKGFGIGLNKKAIYEATKTLDYIIIQGPTPQQIPVAKNVHPNCKIASLLVGILTKAPKEIFRPKGIKSTVKEFSKNVLRVYTNYLTERLVNKYSHIVMGNNPAMESAYKVKNNRFNLVSKGLIRDDEIVAAERKQHEGALRLIFYSRLDPEKNVELLVKAVAELRNGGRETILDIYGGSAVPAYKNYIDNVINKSGVKEYINFRGEIPNNKKVEIFNQSDIYIFNTCTNEGYPRTLWEGFAAGIPTICVNYLGISKFFTKQEALIFKQNSLEDLLAKIKMLDGNEELQKTLVKNAQALLRENTMEKSTQHIYNLLQEALPA
jgi:glycosyltransferase involved in cell wall biosynthesis